MKYDENMAKVSVVIPTYNRRDLLPRAIDSVLKQTVDNFELIIVDDGSTDGTADVIREYSDPRVQYIKQENEGANAARNRGIKTANGEYISFLDSDDEFTENHLETVLQCFDNSTDQIGGFYTSQERYQEKSQIGIDVAHRKLSSRSEVITSYPANGFSSLTFRSQVFDDVGLLDEDLQAYQDREFLIRFLYSFDLDYIREPLVRYYLHDDRLSSDSDCKLDALQRLEKKHRDIIDSSGRDYLHYCRAYEHAKMGSMSASRKSFFIALKCKPLEAKYLIALISTLFGYPGFRAMDKCKRIIKQYVLSYKLPN